MQERRGSWFWVYLVIVGGAVLWIDKHTGFLHAKKGAGRSSPNAHPLATHPGGSGFHLALPSIPSGIIHVALLIVAVLVAGALLHLLVRIWQRRRRARTMTVHEIILGPDDEATPQEVKKVLTSIHGTMLTRYAQAALGQDSWSFEVLRSPDGAIHFLIAAPGRRIKGIEDHLRSKYTNIRMVPYLAQQRRYQWAQQIRLQKDWHFATETVRDYSSSIIESVVAAVDRADGPMHLQYLMTPLPVTKYQQEIKQRLRKMEYGARKEQAYDPFAPGVGMATGELEKRAMEYDGKAPYMVEIRLGSDDWDTAQQVYGAVGEANSENRFEASLVVVGKGLWHKWLDLRLRSLFLFKGSVMFSVALATLIHLPTVRLRVTSMQRNWIRRGNADTHSPRNKELALVTDEIGTVGIPEEDRQANILALGSQGTGKSTMLMHVLKNDAIYKDRQGRPKAVVLVDIGKDTAKRGLGLVPPDREVVYVDPADPQCPWSLNPMGQSDISPAVLSDNMIEALVEIYGEESIRARSREFLGNAFIAIREVMGREANFTQVYQLLTDPGFRLKIIQGVKDPHQVAYWRGTFTNMVQQNPKFIEEGLAAPRNKLDGLLRSEDIRRVLGGRDTGRVDVDFRDVIAGRKVLLLNFDKSRLGEESARTLGVFSIMMLWHAIQSQGVLEERDRVKVSLIIDEAQNFLSEGFLQILSEGRAYGVQSALAMRFVGEVLSDRVQEGIESLVENLVFHRLSSVKEADEKMRKLMRTYANMVQVNAESQDRISFGADDFLKLPNHHSICRFMAHGRPGPAFHAESIPWEPYFNADWLTEHLDGQPEPGEPTEKEPDLPPPDIKDSLTGLSKREPMDWWLRTGPRGYVVVFMDLDGLKALNDLSGDGHAKGDEYITKAGRVIRSSIRDDDMAYRSGGDEFVAFIHGGEKAGAAFELRVRDGFRLEDVSASIGVAVQAEGEDLAETVRRADALMYQDKRARNAGRDVMPPGQAGKAVETTQTVSNTRELPKQVEDDPWRQGLTPPPEDEEMVWLGEEPQEAPQPLSNKPTPPRDPRLQRMAERAANRLATSTESVMDVLSQEGIDADSFRAFGKEFFKVHPSATLVEFRLGWRHWSEGHSVTVNR